MGCRKQLWQTADKSLCIIYRPHSLTTIYSSFTDFASFPFISSQIFAQRHNKEVTHLHAVSGELFRLEEKGNRQHFGIGTVITSSWSIKCNREVGTHWSIKCNREVGTHWSMAQTNRLSNRLWCRFFLLVCQLIKVAVAVFLLWLYFRENIYDVLI